MESVELHDEVVEFLKGKRIICYDFKPKFDIVYSDNKSYLRDDVQTICKWQGCNFTDSNSCKSKMKNYLIAKKFIKCQSYQCISTNPEINGIKTNLNYTTEYDLVSKKTFRGVWNKSALSAELYVNTKYNNLFGIDISQCDITEFKHLPQHLTENFVEWIEISKYLGIKFKEPLYTILYKGVVFVQVSLDLAYLVISKNMTIDRYLNRNFISTSENEKEIIEENDFHANYYANYKLHCNNQIKHLVNHEKYILNAMFSSYCLSSIDGDISRDGKLLDDNIVDTNVCVSFFTKKRKIVNDKIVYFFRTNKVTYFTIEIY